MEIRIFATKDVALDQFKEHFFGRKESFYLKDSENWLQNMLSLYQDSGFRRFQAIKVRLKFSLKSDFRANMAIVKFRKYTKLLRIIQTLFSSILKMTNWKTSSENLDAWSTIESFEKLMINQSLVFAYIWSSMISAAINIKIKMILNSNNCFRKSDFC